MNPVVISQPARFISLITCILVLLLFGVSPPPASASTQEQDLALRNTQPTLPSGIQESWWSQVQQDIKKSEFHIKWHDQAPRDEWRGSYQATNRDHNFRTFFTKDGVRVIPRVSEGENNQSWYWGITLTAFGSGSDLKPVSQSTLVASPTRVEYRYSNITEWYLNDSSGLEQGFTLMSPPDAAGSDTATLVMSFSLETNLQANIADDRQSIHFSGAEAGAANVLEFGNLAAWDANSKQLPIQFALSENRLELIISASDAVYPLTIDPLLTSTSWQGEGNQNDAHYGFSVATAGDINGDGYSDVIVGTPQYNVIWKGAAFVYLGSASGLSTTPSWTVEGDQVEANFGASVATAGDVNGDGFSDVIVGAPGYEIPPLFILSQAERFDGAAFIYYGSANGLSTTASTILSGNQIDAYFGGSVATAGDVNGDGYSDVIVGAPQYDNNFNDEGAAFVYLGSANGISTNPTTALYGNKIGSRFGVSVSTAGDVNGDGYNDIIVGAMFYNNTLSTEGAAFVYLGSASGLASIASTSLYGNQAGANFGVSVATAGDVNGDGYSDVIVGAFLFDNTINNEGAAFVFLGSSSGLTNFPSTSLYGGQDSSQFGGSVATTGDINGDGYSDVIVGASLFDRSRINSGAAFVYLGSSIGIANTTTILLDSNQIDSELGNSVATAGDVNGDGFSDVIVGAYLYDNIQNNEGSSFVYLGSSSGLSDSVPVVLENSQDTSRFGIAVSTAGDTNGDGYSDVVVGATLYDNGQLNEGAVFIYLGSATGLPTSPSQILEVNKAGAYFGNVVTTAGDVNGDGYSDVLVGAPLYNGTQGRVFLFLGSPSGVSITPSWFTNGNESRTSIFGGSIPLSEPFVFEGLSASLAGDVNGDGFSDVIIGTSLYDNGQQDEGAVFIYHGSSEGLANTPATIIEGDQVEASFGGSVSSAGDINGDGFSDVIVGAYQYDNGQTNEGVAFVYYGSPEGILSTGTILEADQQGARFGIYVSTAGDVNGDGFSDVLVSGTLFDNGPRYGYDFPDQAGNRGQGVVYVYMGSPNGIGTTAARELTGIEGWPFLNPYTLSAFGYGVSSAGDLNGDGYSDVIIGAQYPRGDGVGAMALIYQGSKFGLNIPAKVALRPDGQFMWLWTNIASTAGDVNGDGFSDVIVGFEDAEDGPFDLTNNGRAFLYYGNGNGINLKPEVRQATNTQPIVTGTSTFGATDFQLSMIGRTFFGRGKNRLEVEVKPFGRSFNGENTTVSTFSVPVGGTLGTVELTKLIGGLTLGERYHWRMRQRYDLVTSPFQQAGRWVSPIENGWQEMDFRTDDDSSPDDTSNGFPIPGLIQAEDYNTGGPNVGYFDTTPGNTGGAYRSDNVDIGPTTDAGGGFNVGWISSGEWLKYDVSVQSTGIYKLELRVARKTSGTKRMHVEMGGVNVTGNITIPSTGGWQTYTTVTVNNVNLTAGVHVMRLFFDSNEFNLNWVKFTLVGGSPNSAPVAQAGNLLLDQDVIANGTLVATDANSDPLFFSIVTPAAHGIAAITNAATGAYTYTPNLGYSGPDSFTFKANDSQVDSNTALISITINSTSLGTGYPIPGLIQAEDYNTGGPNVGYFDTTPGNTGGAYRSDNVDIGPTTDTGGGFNVGWINSGEWLKYDVSVQSTGVYKLELRVARKTSGTKRMHVEMDGVNVTGNITIPSTGGWQTFTTVTVNNINLTAGAHVMRLFFDSNEFNLNWVRFVKLP